MASEESLPHNRPQDSCSSTAWAAWRVWESLKSGLPIGVDLVDLESCLWLSPKASSMQALTKLHAMPYFTAWAWFDKNAGYWLGLDVPKYAWAISEHNRLLKEVGLHLTLFDFPAVLLTGQRMARMCAVGVLFTNASAVATSNVVSSAECEQQGCECLRFCSVSLRETLEIPVRFISPKGGSSCASEHG
eukprot:scaffold73504_cov16-Tisochrysis_lutea.AAC.1